MTHVIVAGMGYGDEGKGSIVEYLCSRGSVSTVVKFNGGPQAGHRAVMMDGREHTFSQWGAGTFRGVPTFHSRYVALDPMAMEPEADHLIKEGVPNPYRLITVDPNCLIVTPFHKGVNRYLEREREDKRHGSCGMGHGVAVGHSLQYPTEALRVADIIDGTMEKKLKLQQKRFVWYLEEYTSLAKIRDYYYMWLGEIKVSDPNYLKNQAEVGNIVFEGAQGVLLDEWYGFHPYTTWSTTTFQNAIILLAENKLTATKLGVLRAYATRHGVGPFITEDRLSYPTYEHNEYNEWQGPFRLGHFDAVASKYSCGIAKPDVLALTHLDNATELAHYCIAYEPMESVIPAIKPENLAARAKLTKRVFKCHPVYAQRSRGWTSTIEELLKVPVTLESWGPMAEDKRERMIT